MVGLRLWLRRCTAAKAVPALIAASVVLVASRHGWERDWRWAVDWAASAVYLTGPALAGLVAFDRSRRVEPTVADLGRSAPRAVRGMLALVLASWVWSLVGWAAALLYVAIRVQQSDAVGQPDPWSLVIPPAVLLACGAFGLVIGAVLPNLAAGPVAAVTCYVVALTPLMQSLGLPAILTVDPSTGTRIGLERDDLASLAQVGMQLVVVLVAVLWIARSAALVNRLRWAASLALGAAMVISLLGFGAVNTRIDPWRAADLPEECLGERVVVCGPSEAGSLLQGAHGSVEAAVHRLGTSGVDWQTRYVWAPTPDEVPADSGQLSMQLEGMTGDNLSTDDIAYTLMTPRVCKAFFTAEGSAELMGSQRLVLDWVLVELRWQGRVERASPEVVSAYQRLRSCEPVNGPAQEGR